MKDKTSIITGGARGIGEAIARVLASRGSHVLLWDVLADEAKATAEAIAREYDVKAEGAAVDVTDADAVDAAVKAARDGSGQIDVLVNNAGITRDNLLVRMKEDDWDRVLQINLKGVFLCTKAVGRFMCKARTGAIVMVTVPATIIASAGRGVARNMMPNRSRS